MKIAQVAPLHESVPPRCYGGTERVVSYLTEELVRQGHTVTLFASGDSASVAELVPGCAHSLRTDPGCVQRLPYELVQMGQVLRRAHEFDVLHFHGEGLHLPFCRQGHLRALATMHGRLDIPELVPLYREYPDAPVISISHAQRAPLEWLNWRATVYHGLPEDLYALHLESRGYLAFIGRLSPEKRLDRAVEIARRSGLPLRVAAKIDAADREYFEREAKALLSSPGVEFVGEIGDEQKDAFLGGALALLFPIDWPEPFGLVMIEAMACGTPVVAFRRGSVPEVVDEGVSGFVVETVEEAVRACGRITSLKREGCRQAFERRFSAKRMARDYLKVYESLQY